MSRPRTHKTYTRPCDGVNIPTAQVVTGPVIPQKDKNIPGGVLILICFVCLSCGAPRTEEFRVRVHDVLLLVVASPIFLKHLRQRECLGNFTSGSCNHVHVSDMCVQ